MPPRVSQPKAAGKLASRPAKPKRAPNGAGGRNAPEKRPRSRAAPSDLDAEIESDSDDEDDPRARARARGGKGAAAAAAASDGSSEEDAEDAETADEHRVRMAKAMLAKLEAAKRASAREGGSEGGSSAAEEEIDRELAKQAAQAAGRHFERVAARLLTAPAAPPVQAQRGHRRAPTALALSADERTAFSASKDGELLRWDLEAGGRVRLTPKQGKRSPIACLALSHDGNLLATGGPDKLLHVWDVRTGKCAESFKVRQARPAREEPVARGPLSPSSRAARTLCPAGPPRRPDGARVWRPQERALQRGARPDGQGVEPRRDGLRRDALRARGRDQRHRLALGRARGQRGRRPDGPAVEGSGGDAARLPRPLRAHRLRAHAHAQLIPHRLAGRCAAPPMPARAPAARRPQSPPGRAKAPRPHARPSRAAACALPALPAPQAR